MLENIDNLEDFDRSVGTTMAVCAGLTIAAFLGLVTWGIWRLMQ